MVFDILAIVLTIAGLCLFEVVCGIDNAVINAEVLRTMSLRARRWFLFWGMLFAVFVVRGLLPWLIIWFTTPNLGLVNSFTATFTDSSVIETIELSALILFMGGGIFLIFLFFHWLFLEPKIYGLHAERFFEKQGVWFYAVVSIILAAVVWFSLKTENPLTAFGAVVGSTAFFITHGFKQQAEKIEHDMIHAKGHLSDWSK